MTRVRLLTLTTVVALILSAGCTRKTPVTQAPPPQPVVDDVAQAPPPPPEPAAAESPAPVASAPLSEEDLFARKTLDELNAERPLRDVFFDLDETTIREDARVTLQANAAWLRRWTSTRIAIEGHADDRGTREYNLALGARRAAAVRDYLVDLGVDTDRLVTLSKGEESPVCFGEGEDCWRQNRRGHAVITAK